MTEATNPYSSPEGELLTESDEYGEIKFFSPSSRVGRLRYFAHGFLFMLLMYALLIPGFLLMMVSETLGIIVLGAGYIAALVIFVILMVQRMHDLNRSGWWLLLFFVPIANLIIALYIMLWPGTKGQNNFGLRPPPNKTWHWILGLMIPVLMTIGILAAVAIPAYQDYTERANAAQQSLFQD